MDENKKYRDGLNCFLRLVDKMKNYREDLINCFVDRLNTKIVNEVVVIMEKEI